MNKVTSDEVGKKASLVWRTASNQIRKLETAKRQIDGAIELLEAAKSVAASALVQKEGEEPE